MEAFAEDPEARIVSAICGGIKVSSVYVPNGREVDHDHYRYNPALELEPPHFSHEEELLARSGMFTED